MASITRHLPTEQDIAYLAENMRQSDIEELSAVTDQSLVCAVRSSVLNSHPDYLWAYCVDGDLVLIYGCTRSGSPWMLGTEALNQNLKELTVRTRVVVRDMLKQFPVLSNIIDVRQKKTIRWLKTIGFSFKETFEIKLGVPVIRFEMRVTNE
ncbi:MAG: hypothetical protein WC762_03160 [Methylobacter sp.]